MPTTIGPEVVVNATTFRQASSSVAHFSDGSFVVIWHATSGTPGLFIPDFRIYGQLFTPNGAPNGSSFLVSPGLESVQWGPSVCTLNDDRFVVSWFSAISDTEVRAQIFNPDGTTDGAQFLVNQTTAGTQRTPKLAALDDGGFVATWASSGQDGSGYAVYGQRFSASGLRIGNEFQINTFVQGDQTLPAVSPSADGGFVVTWASDGQDGAGLGIYAQLFDSSGQPTGDEFQVNSSVTGSQSNPAVALLADGTFVITWNTDRPDGFQDIYARIFDATATPTGAEFQVNTYTVNHQSLPSISSVGDGFLVTWQSDTQDGSGLGIYGQQFNADGTRVGDEFLVNSTISGAQSAPSTTTLSDGEFVVAWTSSERTYAQLFEADQPQSNDMLASLLFENWHWDNGIPVNTPPPPNGVTNLLYYLNDGGLRPWTAAEAVAFATAAASWENVANIGFEPTANEGDAQLNEFLLDALALDGATGAHDTPERAATQGNQAVGAFNAEAPGFVTPGGLGIGGRGYNTLVHELGHALGLDHPHPDDYPPSDGVIDNAPHFPNVTASSDDYGDNDLNQGIYTVMSYNRGWDATQNPDGNVTLTYGYISGPSAFDIAAVQYLYGANMNRADTDGNGNPDDTYVLPDNNSAGTFWTCIWDTGGIDTISYLGIGNAVINLTAATLDNSPTGGGVLSYADPDIFGGFTIANGVEIENAVGGAGNDIIAGNHLGNFLVGNNGDDTLNGGDGADILVGGDGTDILNGGDGVDTVSYASSLGSVVASVTGEFVFGSDVFTGIENIIGSSTSDRLIGDNNANALFGGGGPDRIMGRGGNDILDGGDGLEDTVSFEETTLGVTVNLGANAASGAEIGADQLFGFERVIGGNGSDMLIGDGNSNNFEGGADADFIDGGAGSDTASYETASGGITARLDLGFGQDDGGAFDTYVSIENVLGSWHADVIVGKPGEANTLSGGFLGDDIFYGEGIDEVIGGLGNDVFFGGQGGALNLNTADIETVWGSVVGDTIDGSTSSANLSLIGQGDADTMSGGSGDDFLYFDNLDIISGGSGNDWAVATLSGAGVTLNMNTTGFENAWGSTSGDTITAAGSATTAVIVGDTGNDILTGGNAGDFLYGFGDNDTLNGGTGNDNLIGGGGTDTFAFGAGWGVDIVWDWQDGVEQFNMQGSGAASFAALTVDQNYFGSGSALISFSGNQILVVGGANLIDAGDFVF